MRFSSRLFCVLLLLSSLALAGCLRPKRTADPGRSYVLSPLPVGAAEKAGPVHDVALGVAPVEIPAYLFDHRIVQRKGNSEIRHMENHRWAERLDKGFQRVLGDNLSLLLESDRIFLSAWQRRAVQAELYLSLQRFECDDRGQVLLEARWRITVPGGETTLLTRHSHITRPTASGPQDMDRAVSQLSQALGDLSREIAAAVPDLLARSKASHSAP